MVVYFVIGCVQNNVQNNAPTWFNKRCRFKQLTPKYFQIKVNGSNTRSIRRQPKINYALIL